MFLGDSHAPIPRGRRGPNVPKIFWIYMQADNMRNGHQILHGDQTGCDKIFQGRPQMLTRDLFAILSLHGDSCAHLLRATLDHAALTVKSNQIKSNLFVT